MEFEIILNPQEFLVTDVYRVADFIDKEIGNEYEITKDEYSICGKFGGSVVVFELTPEERQLIRAFISKENLWSE